MPMVTCPYCKEQGRIPKSFIGKQIKCSKCEKRFMVTPPPEKVGAAKEESHSPVTEAKEPTTQPAHVTSHSDEIAIEGMDADSWPALAVTTAEEHHPSEQEAQGTFTAAPADQPTGGPEYKVLTQKDKFFTGKFELSRLEDAVNHYARQGWKVKAMTSTTIYGYSGGPREEMVLLLER